MAKKRGAKLLRREMVRSELIHVKLRPGEREAVEQMATQVGTTVSTLGRTAMLRELGRLRRQQQTEKAVTTG